MKKELLSHTDEKIVVRQLYSNSYRWIQWSVIRRSFNHYDEISRNRVCVVWKETGDVMSYITFLPRLLELVRSAVRRKSLMVYSVALTILQFPVFRSKGLNSIRVPCKNTDRGVPQTSN